MPDGNMSLPCCGCHGDVARLFLVVVVMVTSEEFPHVDPQLQEVVDYTNFGCWMG